MDVERALSSSRPEETAARRAWLAGVPAHADALAAAWRLRLGRPFAAPISWVAPARRDDGVACVLKLVAPDPQPGLDGSAEAAALRAFGGHGAVRLLAHDPARHALLVERVTPGTALADTLPAGERAATETAGELIALLHGCGPVPGLLAVADYTRALAQEPAGSMSRWPPPWPDLLARAQSVRAELLAGEVAATTLHGDLHHDNVLLDRDRGWLAIDPKGLLGDPAYDAATFLYNPLDGPRPGRAGRLADQRAQRLAERAGLELDRVRSWGLVQAVLVEVWSAERGRSCLAPVLGEVAAALAARLP